MKIVTFLFGLMLATPALAHSYQWYYKQNLVCEAVGDMAISAYDGRQSGWPINRLFNEVDQPWARHGIEYGYYKANNAKSAYKIGWARCMNSFGKLYDNLYSPRKGDWN